MTYFLACEIGFW